MVGVAQLVEPQIVDLVVVGSSPIVHPTQVRGRPRPRRGQDALVPGPLKLWQYCTPSGRRQLPDTTGR